MNPSFSQDLAPAAIGPSQNPNGLTTSSDFSQAPITQALGQNTMQVSPQQPPMQPMHPNPQNSQLGLNPAHDAIYERLRQLFMSLHKQGVPGIDQLLSALTKTHVGLTGKQQLGKQPASPQNPTPAGYYSGQ